MSRSRSLKEKTRKSTIKATMASLALVLSIVSTQTMGTYALFKDTDDVIDRLTISTGDVDVALDPGFNKIDLGPGSKISHSFNINNKGTLRQQLTLKLECLNKNISQEVLNSFTQYIECNLNFESYNGRSIKPITGTLNNLLNKDIQLEYSDGKGGIVVASSHTYIKATMNISIGDISSQIENPFANNPMKLSLKSLARQADNNQQGLGFYDIDNQDNFLKFEEVLPSEGNIGAHLEASGSQIKLNISDIKEIDVKNIGYISIVPEKCTGVFAYDASYGGQNNNFMFINKDSGIFDMKNLEFDKINMAVFRFDMEDESYKIIRFRFRYNDKNDNNNNGKLEAYYEIIDSGINRKFEIIEKDVVESQKEGVVIPNETDGIELQKEEVVITNKSEENESDKEEMFEPSNLDTIEPSKEEIEIQIQE